MGVFLTHGPDHHRTVIRTDSRTTHGGHSTGADSTAAVGDRVVDERPTTGTGTETDGIAAAAAAGVTSMDIRKHAEKKGAAIEHQPQPQQLKQHLRTRDSWDIIAKPATYELPA